MHVRALLCVCVWVRVVVPILRIQMWLPTEFGPVTKMKRDRARGRDKYTPLHSEYTKDKPAT